MEDIIKVSNVSFCYNNIENNQLVLDNISLNIKKGEFVAIIGRNGSGKSTLARHFNALLIPSSGSVYIKNMHSANYENIWNIRKTVGMVFQNPDNQIVATIVEEDTAFGPENLAIPSDEIKKRVQWALKAVDMYEYRNHATHMLSGGQKQRVAIAGVIAMKPECMVLDEPTAMLDPIGRQEVIDVVKKLNKEEVITTVLITHFMDEAVQADRVVVIDRGRIVMDASPREVFVKVDELKAIGLDVPQVTELQYLLKKAGVSIGNNVLMVDECVNMLEKLLENKGHKGTDIMSREPFARHDNLPIAIPTAIKVEGLSYTYMSGSPFERQALQDININISKGEYLGIIGHTGSGKTTLVQHFNGLLKPTKGRVIVNDIDINSKGAKTKGIRNRVGLVFQYPEHQLFEETVYDDIAFAPKNLGLSDSEVRQRVLETIRITGLGEGILYKSPYDLSGGQKRRVAIAGVLAMKPDILILDEPTAGLDPSGREEILMQIKNMRDKLGITVILVSHNMEDIAKYVDGIIVMHSGSVFMKGEKAEIFKRSDTLRGIGLGIPQITQVFQSLKNKGFKVAEDIFTVNSAKNEILSLIKGRVEIND